MAYLDSKDESKLKHSAFGVASFVISLTGLVILFISIGSFLIYPDMNPKSSLLADLWYFGPIISGITPILGLVLGIVSFFHKRTNHYYASIGIGIAGLTLPWTFWMIIETFPLFFYGRSS